MNAANDDFEGPIGADFMPAHTRQAGVGLSHTRLRSVGAKTWDGLNALHLPFAAGLMLALWAIIELERWLV